MKVVFLEDVPNVARAGEAKEVADGYGRNYLLPKKLAVLANSQASAVVEVQLKKIARRRAETEAEMAEIAAKLNGMEIVIKAKTGAKDRLYGSITGADVADELSNRIGAVVDKRKIEMEEPIRQVGSYELTVRFTHDIAAVVKLVVEAEKEVEEKEEKKVKAKPKKKAEEAKAEEEEATKAGAKAEEMESKTEEAETGE